MGIGPIQTKWLTELRSGKFSQGFGLLNCNERYCCLGVLCEVLIDHGHFISKEVEKDNRVRYSQNVGEAPTAAREMAGLTYAGSIKLIKLNDGLKLSFDEIADEIEKDPEFYFKEEL